MLQVVKNNIITSGIEDAKNIAKQYVGAQAENAVYQTISDNLYIIGPVLSLKSDSCFFDVYNGNRMVYYAALLSCEDGSVKLCLDYSIYEYFDLHVLMRIVKFVSLTMRQCGLKPKEVFLKIDARYGYNLPFTLKTFKRPKKYSRD